MVLRSNKLLVLQKNGVIGDKECHQETTRFASVSHLLPAETLSVRLFLMPQAHRLLHRPHQGTRVREVLRYGGHLGARERGHDHRRLHHQHRGARHLLHGGDSREPGPVRGTSLKGGLRRDGRVPLLRRPRPRLGPGAQGPRRRHGRHEGHGVEYEERLERLAEVTYPKPLEELLDRAFELHCQGVPWARDYFAEHNESRLDGDARSAAYLSIDESPEAEQHLWHVRQIFLDENADGDFRIEADVNLDATQEEGEVIFKNYRVGFVEDLAE